MSHADPTSRTRERLRLNECHDANVPWKAWGPYLSERQWGTVREDYSAFGEAWNYFPHDHARSRAYRWGEDGLAGFCDDQQQLCLALALWNGRDPILKERLFGLANAEGNHGEDVKEQYYFLDATPTHSYLKMLYKYPQAEFPYARLVAENRQRGADSPEFDLLDTGIFDADRYFDVFVEYAKAGPHDVLMRISIFNRGPAAEILHVLPQLWFRNTWDWQAGTPKPTLRALEPGMIGAAHAALGEYTLHYEVDRAPPTPLFCDNETDTQRHFDFPGPAYPKDAFHTHVVGRRADAVNPTRTGTKSALHYELSLAAGASCQLRLRLTAGPRALAFADFDEIFAKRVRECDEFYAALQERIEDEDQRRLQRQALAGLVWSKQVYHFDVRVWQNGDPAQPAPPAERQQRRNADWSHFRGSDVISMPDTWEYPWFAAWDLAFHCIPFALLDVEFAKEQLLLLTREEYMHPNGQLPAYEWAFGDVNPPVHAWATWRVYQIDKKQKGGTGDLRFLRRVFHKLLLNFTWWVNRKDADGRNIFQGGFLGLDNIGVFDRSQPLPTGGYINQSDGTAWMAMFCLNMMRIALELAHADDVYEDLACKFFEHFLHIAEAMTKFGTQSDGLWDDTDKFYYDALNLPDGRKVPLKIRSMVGLIPLFAVEVLHSETILRLPRFGAHLKWLLEQRPDLAQLVSRWQETNQGERHLLSLLRGHRMTRLLRRMLDETEFLSEFGVRALSRHHYDQPYVLRLNDRDYTVRYTPGESSTSLFGGNSNWRGPIWMPVNFLIIESLQRFHHYYGDDFKIECPTGSGKYLTILEVADELGRRLTRLFLRDDKGRRPIFGNSEKLQNDPHFRDYILFHEYFHGDNGTGLGAAHQTGWTALVAKLLQPRRTDATHSLYPQVLG